MKLAEVEEWFGVTFPKRFHEIYDTGAMEWLELSNAEFREKRDKYINDPKAFMMMNGEFEPLSFEEIPERAKELAERLSWRADDTGEKVRGGITLVPFAQSGGGDMHLLVYEGDAEPKIVMYYADCYDAPQLWGRDFDECLYYAMLEALQWDEDMNGAAWQAHLNYLNGKYRAKITGKSAEELLEDFKQLGLELDKNAVNIFEVKNDEMIRG